MLKIMYVSKNQSLFLNQGRMSVLKPITLLIVGIAASAALFGCGGGGQSSTVAAVTVNSAVTKAQFRERANAICNEGKTEISLTLVHRAEKEGKTSVAEMEPAVQTEILLTSLRKQLTELGEIGAPPKDRSQVEAFMTAFQNAVDTIEEKELRGKEQIQPVLLTIYKPALAYGLKGCGYGE